MIFTIGGTTPTRLLNRIITPVIKNFSSSYEKSRFLELKFPKQSAERFSKQIKDYYQSSKDIKPLTKDDVILWSDILTETIKKTEPQFLDYLHNLRQNKPLITSITGLPINELEPSEIPHTIQASESQDFAHKIRPSEITITAIAEIFGINVEDHNSPNETKLVDYIVPLKHKKNMHNDFRSEQEMGYHTDGWLQEKSANFVLLLCVVSNKRFITEIITTNQIIDYFIENGHEDLLERLANDYYPKPFIESPQKIKLPILDEDRNINFSTYGEFEPTNKTKSSAEIYILQKALMELVPNFSKSLEISQLIILDNKKSIHGRKLLPESVNDEEEKPNTKPNIIEKRLLARTSGNEIEK